MSGRSYSYSPSPPRGYRRARLLPRSPSPRGRYGGRSRDMRSPSPRGRYRGRSRDVRSRSPRGRYGGRSRDMCSPSRGRSRDMRSPSRGRSRDMRSPIPRGRYRGRSREMRSPSPRGHGGRSRDMQSPSPRGRYGSRGRDMRDPSPKGRCGGRSRDIRSPSPRGRNRRPSREKGTSIVVRNLPHDCGIEDLRRLFGQFGLLKDIYLPRDLNTGELCGFASIEFANPSDAADARYNLEGEVLRGRELTILFAVEDRKKRSEMRTRDHVRGRDIEPRRPRSPPRDRRSRFSWSPAYSPSSRGRRYSRSTSPRDISQRSISPRDGNQKSISPRDGNQKSISPMDGNYRDRSYLDQMSTPSGSRTRSPDTPSGSRSPDTPNVARLVAWINSLAAAGRTVTVQISRV